MKHNLEALTNAIRVMNESADYVEKKERELVELTTDRNNWKIRAEELDGYKADCMELREELKRITAESSDLRANRPPPQPMRMPTTEEWHELEGLRTKLAKVTAERNGAPETLGSVRARVAELEAAWDDIRGYLRCKDKSLPTIQGVLDRLAKRHETEQYAKGYDDMKLEAEKEVAALRAQIENWKRGCDYQRTRAEQRVTESAAPAKHPDTERLRLFTWDGNNHVLLPASAYYQPTNGVLRFPMPVGNGSISVGMSLVLLDGKVVAIDAARKEASS